MRPGLRVWTEPPQVASTSSPGKLSLFPAHHGGILIPRDPNQKDHEIQFMKSSDATQDVLPKEGVTVVASLIHMHLAGIRAHVSIIRDGVQIKTIEWKGYDFASKNFPL